MRLVTISPARTRPVSLSGYGCNLGSIGACSGNCSGCSKRQPTVARMAGLGEWSYGACTGAPPLPMECFSSAGANRTQATTYAARAEEDNENIARAHQIAVDNWNLNNGFRWVNGVWTQTSEPPPPPPRMETDVETIIAAMERGEAWNPTNEQMPYYMGGGVTTVTQPNRMLVAGSMSVYDYGTQALNPDYYPTASPAATAGPVAPTTAEGWYALDPTQYTTQEWNQLSAEWQRQENARRAAATPAPTAPAPAPAPAPTAPAPAATTTTTTTPTPAPAAPQPAPTTVSIAPPASTTANYNPQLGPTGTAPQPARTGSTTTIVTTPDDRDIVGQAGTMLRTATGAALPASIAQHLPDWIADAPVALTGAAVAAALYFAMKGKGRR